MEEWVSWKERAIFYEKRKSLTDSETTELKEQIKELQLDVYRLQMEKDILEKASEIIKKD